MLVRMKKPFNQNQYEQLTITLQETQKLCPEIVRTMIYPEDLLEIELLPLDGSKLEPKPELERELLDKVVRLIDLQ